VYSKKKGAAFELTDDMFGEGASDPGDLFSSTPSQKANDVVAPTPTKAQDMVSSRRKLDPVKRTARFNELFEFVSGRIGLKPTAKTPEQVRDSAWGHLFDLATTRAQLERVAELFPQWRDSRRKFNEQTVKKFIGKWFGLDGQLSFNHMRQDDAMNSNAPTLPWKSSATTRNTVSRSRPLLLRVT